MNETLGKRISAHRKRLGLTQDKLAEALGVTAQAVSKWENDQSCPDITTLPKLAQIFSVSTDALLGLEKPEVHPAEVISPPAAKDAESKGLHIQNDNLEFHWDGGRRNALGVALWVFVSGGLLFASSYFHWDVSFFRILWTSGLLLFGLFGLYPHVSHVSGFRLCCGILGGYSLFSTIIPMRLEKDYLLALFLLLMGLSLLTNALKKPRHGHFHITRNGKTVSGSSKNHCEYSDNRFSCNVSFGDQCFPIQLDLFAGGEASVSFGELTADLSGCQKAAEDCTLDLDCSFGAMTVLIPKRFRLDPVCDTSFGSVEIDGEPVPEAVPITALCDVSFGSITLQYI